jgi:hypothetical protein
MPRIDDIIDQLGGVKYISTLDLTSGYWQVPMRKANCHKTVLTTQMGLYQQIGLSRAPCSHVPENDG